MFPLPKPQIQPETTPAPCHVRQMHQSGEYSRAARGRLARRGDVPMTLVADRSNATVFPGAVRDSAGCSGWGGST
eukprot:9437184-Pyramimonas_sp.AAC.2